MALIQQVIATAITCYLSISMGILFAWPSCTLRLFASQNTTLHRPMTEVELALFGSLSSIGAFIGTPVAAYFLDITGRKYSCVICALTTVIAWAMIASCNRVEVLLSAIFVSGFGGAVFLIAPVYISEICQESIRGMMMSFSMIFYGVGMLISYVLGGYTEYNVMVYISMSMAVLGVCGLFFLKESPMFLMKKGLEEETAKILAFYRSCTPNDKEVMQEMDAMRRALNPDLEGESLPTSHEEATLKPPKVQEQKEKLSFWQFFKKSKSTRQATFVTMTLMTASIFQGLTVVQVYAEPLFEDAVPNMSATISSIIFSIISIISGFMSSYLLERAGRRPLMIYASFAAGITCVVLGSQLQALWAPHWMTAVLIYLFCITYILGPGTVPFVLGPEVFLPEVKTILSMFLTEWIFLCYFVILFIFNPLVNAIGLGAVFYVFATICFLTSVFSIFFQPETKGLPVDEIQGLFLRKWRQPKVV